ncbi:MFS transporter [Streptomyces sp. RS10V-4]|uniref:MFS transporter n=1 Tax=Streptomyces rhizoryzae TaxID=2932493 RepID=UPI0020051838|nr:MFS transporter [Streptomyces rhizoryzae]MCK7624986.1 MFS transporter [Streptomyces rhizoryzae]
MAAAAIGNVVEWYDWHLYTFLAGYLTADVFPAAAGTSLVPLLSLFAVFAVGFFMRPVGGLLLGAVADRHGRRTALTATLLMMGGSSLAMALTPAYATAGLLGPVVLTLARLLQGLSAGGEFTASTTFLVESAGPGRRGLFASFHYLAATAGQLLASGTAALLVACLDDRAMHAWGWRLPFLLGALLSLVGLWIRRGVAEPRSARQRQERPKVFDALRTHPRESLLICGITIGGTVAFYTWTSYLPTYAHLNAGTDQGTALLAGTLALLLFALVQPLAGLLSDRIGRRPLLLGFAAGSALLCVPLLNLLTGSFLSLLLVQCAGLLLLTGYTAIAAAVNAEVFPARVRAAGIGFPYSLTVALFGGTAPYVGTLFAQLHLPDAFPWYVAALCLLSAPVFLRLPETAHRPLER